MKNFSLKQKPAVIKTLMEPPKKKATNYQQWSWISILLLIAFFSLKRVCLAYAYVHGEGQVELTKQAITFTNDIQVLAIKVAEGDDVKIGDTLFLYQNEWGDDHQNSMAISIAQPIDWVIKEKLNLKKQIKLKGLEANSFARKIAFKNDELSHQKNLVVLGVNQIESTLTSIQSKLIDYQTRRNLLLNEIKVLKRQLAALRAEEKEIKNLEIKSNNQREQSIWYIAKTDGIIGQINFNNNEVCYEKQDVMTIHQADQISIKAYFDPDEVPYVQLGNKLNITFPDGTLGVGIIQNFYVSTYALPAEFQKKYEPVERNVVVDIAPLNPLEKQKWSNFYKMNVAVEKLRYDLNYAGLFK